MRLGHVVIAMMLLAFGNAPARAEASGAAGRIDAIQRRGTLRVAVLAEYPWLVQKDDAAMFGGPAWQLVTAVAKRLHVRVEPVPVSFGDKIAVLSRDAADLTAAPMLVTPARQAQADLVPYSISAQCLFARADNVKLAGAHDIDDLDRPEVALTFVKGTPAETWLAHRLPHAALHGIPGNTADIPVEEILSGRADAAPIDKFFVADLIRRTPGLVTLPRGEACLASREMEIAVGVAVAKGQPALLKLLQTVARETKPAIEAEEARVLAAGP